MDNRPTRHSYSSLSAYEQCPAKYRFRYIDGLAAEPSAAMMRGTRLHSLAEDYVKAPDTQCPYELKKIGLRLYSLREHGAIPEETWCVDSTWLSCTPDDPLAKIKCVVDVHYVNKEGTLVIHDYKSGREYPSHGDQLSLYACVGLQRYPNAKRADVSALYIDSGAEGHERRILRGMLPRLTAGWSGRIGKLEGDVDLLPTAGSHCRWCPYGVSKGGPCTAEQRSA